MRLAQRYISEGMRIDRHLACVHDLEYRALEGEADEDVWAAAIADDRALVTENVGDFSRIEAEALARGRPAARLVLTTDRQFPRGDSATVGRLVLARMACS